MLGLTSGALNGGSYRLRISIVVGSPIPSRVQREMRILSKKRVWFASTCDCNDLRLYCANVVYYVVMEFHCGSK